MTTLMTSLAEIRSFDPCYTGWKNILSAHPHTCEEDYQKQFPLVDCVESNSISNVCWLIGKRKTEINICVSFAQACADSVTRLNNKYAAKAAFYASEAASYAANSAAASYAADAAAVAADAAVAAVSDDAANAIAADAEAIDVANAVADAVDAQNTKNKQFLIDAINNYYHVNK